MPGGFRIKLADPCIGEAEEQAVIRVMRSGRLVSGPSVARFEEALCAYTGRAHAVMVSSGTAALTAAMHALGVGPGATVVVPAFTFPSPAIAAAYLGARVRLCDVDPGTMNVSARTLAPALDEDVSLVVGIDQFGVPCPVPELEALLGSYGVPLLVDAACSLGSALNGARCGSLGAAATLSFHPRKVITTGEGGAVLTDDEDLARAARRYASIGMEAGRFEGIGTNLRPSEMGAAIGLERLARIDEIVRRRGDLAVRYRDLPLMFQEGPAGSAVNNQTLAAVLPKRADRDELRRFLAERGVEAQVASYNVGALEPLAGILGARREDFPTADDLHRRGVALPLHEGLTAEEVDTVVGLVHDWLLERGADA